ncbi:hypothetical protein ACIQUQ_34605 [Streptomyces sp. NPDC101118]|uniref:hypothetical protein n=1 Tax=Streptomyces sp. NPDC101118 TaxID=3366109 RepID=UPI0037FA5E41
MNEESQPGSTSWCHIVRPVADVRASSYGVARASGSVAGAGEPTALTARTTVSGSARTSCAQSCAARRSASSCSGSGGTAKAVA